MQIEEKYHYSFDAQFIKTKLNSIYLEQLGIQGLNLVLKEIWGTKVNGQVNNGWRLQYTHHQMKKVAVHVTSYNDKKHLLRRF